MKSKLYLKIKGKNIIRFIKRLHSNKIDLLDIKYLNKNEVLIKIYKADFNKIEEIKTSYEVNTAGYDGILKIRKIININKFFIIFISIAIAIIVFLSNLIFEVDIVTNDNKMKEKILNELNNNGIKPYQFKKSYQKIQEIKSNILVKYKHEIDWIEIECVGTKYIIRYEPRIENKTNDVSNFRNIVAKKNAVIYSLDISSGQILKNKKSYVKAGDVIVSGYIYLNDMIKDTISSEGKVYGEVWYDVSVTYPLEYKEEIKTGKNKFVYVIKILNKNIELFNFKKYKEKKIKDKIILKSSILPFSLLKQKQEEIITINEKNSYDDALEKAIAIGKEKIESKLNKEEFILDYKVIEKVNNKDSISVKIFYSVVEDIGEYQKIEEYKLEDNNEFIN